MTSIFRLAKRAPGLAIEGFQRDFATVADWSPARHHGLRLATRALTLLGGYRRGEPVYDVVDEFVFDDEASAAVALEALTPQHELLDPSAIAVLVTEEHVAKDGPIPEVYVKNYEVVTKLRAMERAEFDRYWIEVHGPLAAQIPTIRRYVQAHLAPRFRDSGAASFDGLAITWFDDLNAMRAGLTEPIYHATRADEPNFIDGELPFLITTERVLFRADGDRG
jgi:uncharacterized protein (TIGR02118 family)